MDSQWQLYNPTYKTTIKISKSNFVVGRSAAADIICKDTAFVSRNHAMLYIADNGSLFVVDKGSSNGTYVNRIKTTTESMHRLHANDEVGFGMHSQTELPNRSNKYFYTVQKQENVIKIEDDDEEVPTMTTQGLQDLLDESTSEERVPRVPTTDSNANNHVGCRSTDVETSSSDTGPTEESVDQCDEPPTSNPNKIVSGNGGNIPKQPQDVINVKQEPPDNSNELTTPDTKQSNNSGTLPVQTGGSINQCNKCKIRELSASPSHQNSNSKEASGSPVENGQPALVKLEMEDENFPVVVKEEPKDVPQTVCKYTVEDEVIVIDDDDDDFPCSQLLLENHYSDANERLNESMFFSIKMEVEELDRMSDGAVLAPVFVDSDSDIGDLQNDLLDILNTSDLNTANAYNKLDKVNTASELIQLDADVNKNKLSMWNDHNKLMEVDVNEKEECESNKNHNMEIDKANVDMMGPDPSEVTKKYPSIESEKKLVVILDKSWKGKSKYIKPPLVAPHHEEKPKKGDKPASPRKRKHEKENESCKRIKTSTFYDKIPKRGQPARRNRVESISKESKDLIHEIRKEKLKALVDKPQDDEASASRKPKVGTAKVKVSNSRGKFLTEDHEMPSTSKGIRPTRSSTFKPPAIVDSKNSRRNSLNHLLENNNNVVKNNNQSVKNIHNNQRPTTSSTASAQPNKQPTVNRHNGIQRPAYTHGNHNNVRPNGLNGITNNVSCDDLHEVQDILTMMLQWNPQWFSERRNNESLGLPPIHNGLLKRMTRSFDNYAEYSATVFPLMMIELWAFIYKELHSAGDDKRKREFPAKLESEAKGRNHTVLTFKIHLDRAQNDNHWFVKEGDVVLLQYVFKNSTPNDNQCYGTSTLGYVTEVHKQLLHSKEFIDKPITRDSNAVPVATLTFKMLIKPNRGILQTNKLMGVRVATSLVSTLRVFKSVKYLERSDLCEHILRPTIDLYKLPRIARQQLSSAGKLNPVQVSTVLEATYVCTRNQPGIFLIQGPPGTGKTTVIVSVIQQILFKNSYGKRSTEPCILVVAPSNTAIDELVLRLIQLKPNLSAENRRNLKLVRIGPKNAISRVVHEYELTEIAKRNLFTDLIKTLPKKEHDYLVLLEKTITQLKQQDNPEAQTKLTRVTRDLDRAMRTIMGRTYNDSLRKVEETVLAGARVICTTLSSCVGMRMSEVFGKKSKITCCIVDEATQCNEQESLIPLKLGINRLVLVGDPKQLPAVTFAKEAKQNNHGESLFSRILWNFQGRVDNPIRMLKFQYRMHPDICMYPNQEFYNLELETAKEVMKRNSPLNILTPYRVFSCKVENSDQEYRNNDEIQCAIKLLEAIVMKLPDSCAFSVGIVTPYNVQKNAISEKLKNVVFRSNISISVNTIDSFQGQEKDIIIMSFVRSNTNNFVSDVHRLNVALTRAKFALYIIGSSNLFKTCRTLGKIRDNAVQRRMLLEVSARTSALMFLKLISNK